MLYLAENLKSLRRGKNLTQEDAAELLGVSPQSVSKWERGETLPDITLLPALANLYKVSVDFLLGMDKINQQQTRNAIFIAAHEHLQNGDISATIEVYSEALKLFPSDEGMLSDFAIALALTDDPAQLSRALTLCKRVLAGHRSEKFHHTARAALSLIHLKAGEQEKAVAIAGQLPHARESREHILAEIEREPSAEEINGYLRFIALGEESAT